MLKIDGRNTKVIIDILRVSIQYSESRLGQRFGEILTQYCIPCFVLFHYYNINIVSLVLLKSCTVKLVDLTETCQQQLTSVAE